VEWRKDLSYCYNKEIHEWRQQWGYTAARVAATAVGAEPQRQQSAVLLVSILAQWRSGIRQNQYAWGINDTANVFVK
jgi:hypothetical protein